MKADPTARRANLTDAGRQGLADRLGLTIDPYSQDWEWEVAQLQHFGQYLAFFTEGTLTDAERISLMEMLVQCVEDMLEDERQGQFVSLPEWSTVAGLLRSRPDLHAGTIAYWSVWSETDPESMFRVSSLMRRIWTEVHPNWPSAGDLQARPTQ